MNISPSENHLAPPMLPTLSRYRNLARQMRRISLTRALQYEFFAAQMLKGKVLDVGGGEKAGYKDLLKDAVYDSVNINPATEPTWVVQIGQTFPCTDASYDIVISMNTFEHVFDVQFILKEMFRVLKPGGGLAVAVPFLYPIHADPDDFFRPTPSWFFRALTGIGFRDVLVTPLVWGPFSTGLTCSGAPGPGKGFRRQTALLIDLLYANLRASRRPPEVVNTAMMRCATSFFVKAVR